MNTLKFIYLSIVISLITGCDSKRTFSTDHFEIDFNEIDRIEIRNPSRGICNGSISEFDIIEKNKIEKFINAINESKLDEPWKGACFKQIKLMKSNSNIHLSTNGEVFGFGSSGMFYRFSNLNIEDFKNDTNTLKQEEPIHEVLSLDELNDDYEESDFDFKNLIEHNKVGISLLSGNQNETEYKSKYLGKFNIPAYASNFHVVTQLTQVQAAQVKHGHSLLYFLDTNYNVKKVYHIGLPYQLPIALIDDQLIFKIKGVNESLDLKNGLPVILCIPNDECL